MTERLKEKVKNSDADYAKIIHRDYIKSVLFQ